MEIVYMANQSGQVRWFKTTVDDEQQRAVWKHENGCWRSPKENTVGRTVAAAPWMCGRAAAAMTLRPTVTRVHVLLKPHRSSVVGPQVIRY